MLDGLFNERVPGGQELHGDAVDNDVFALKGKAVLARPIEDWTKRVEGRERATPNEQTRCRGPVWMGREETVVPVGGLEPPTLRL